MLKAQSRQSAKLSPVVGIGTLPTPYPQASVPPPPWFRGEGHTRWRERGWESPNSDEGTYTVVLYIICIYSKYFVVEGEACWWTVHPASKQRSEGEKVRVGDDVIFVSVATERYLVSCRTWTY